MLLNFLFFHMNKYRITENCFFIVENKEYRNQGPDFFIQESGDSFFWVFLENKSFPLDMNFLAPFKAALPNPSFFLLSSFFSAVSSSCISPIPPAPH